VTTHLMWRRYRDLENRNTITRALLRIDLRLRGNRFLMHRVVYPAADLLCVVRRPALWRLHRRLRRHLAAQRAQWRNPYSDNYFYQGLERIGLHGGKPSEARLAKYGISDLLTTDLQVLDIGSNCGFWALSIAPFVKHVDGGEALTISTSVGDRDPLYCTAIGRALLLGMPDAGVRALLRGVKLIPYTRKTTTTIVGVLERLRAFRAQGYAFDDEERHAGVQCLAAPVRDHHGDVVGAIGISAPTLRVVKAGENVFAEAVLEAARSLSARLGFAAE